MQNRQYTVQSNKFVLFMSSFCSEREIGIVISGDVQPFLFALIEDFIN